MSEKEIVVNEEMIKKAKTAGSVEELLVMAKENGYEMTEEEAKTVFSRFNSTGELADDELETVAGGSCDHKEYDKCPNCQSINIQWEGGPGQWYCIDCTHRWS